MYAAAYRPYELKQDEFNFVCYRCGHAKVITGSALQKLKNNHRVRLRCVCGDIQNFVFERRRNIRKPLYLTGVFYHNDSDGNTNFGEINITDISVDGMCFKAKELTHRPLAVGNNVLIKFRVNSMPHSMVTKRASIKNIKSDCYHVEFCENSKASNDLCLKILLYS